MAVSASSLQSLRDEASCSICLDYFQDPVTIGRCGHSFCRGCIFRCLRASYSQGLKRTCPQCRAPLANGQLLANRHLASVVEISRRMRQEAKREREAARKRGGGGGGGGLGRGGGACSSSSSSTEEDGGGGGGPGRECEEHQEPLKLFCKTDQALICVVCRESRLHRSHHVLPAKEAALELKNLVQAKVDALKKRKDEVVKLKRDSRLEGQSFLMQVDAERQQLVAQFEELHEVMEEKRRVLLMRLQELDKGILKQRDEQSAKLVKESTSLDLFIQEMEEKCQQPANEFLQDVSTTLERCEVEIPQVPDAFPPGIKDQIGEFSVINNFLQHVMSNFKDTLIAEHQLCKEAVTLDPATAHPDLTLSKDQRSVTLQPMGQPLPNIPERFDTCTCILGSTGFRAGKHWWEVEVEERGVWAVGVAMTSVKRKGLVYFNPGEGIWAVGQLQGGHYRALTTTKHHLLLKEKLRKLRITLDYEKEEVAFFNPDTQSRIFVFSSAHFEGEEIFPWFWVGGLATKLRLTF